MNNVLKKSCEQIFELYNFLEFLVKLYLTFSSMLIFGIAGFLTAKLFRFNFLWLWIITLTSSIIVTIYLTLTCRNIYNFIYHNYIKQYIPKKKKRMRDNIH